MKNELTTNFKNSFLLSPFFEDLEEGFKHLDFWSDDGNNAYQLQVELPGVDKEDIKVNLGKDHVEISATKKVKSKNKETERYYHNYFSVPTTLNSDSLEASYVNGVLTLSAEKKEEPAKKHIKIK